MHAHMHTHSQLVGAEAQGWGTVPKEELGKGQEGPGSYLPENPEAI